MRRLGVIIFGASIYDYWHELDDLRFAASAAAFRDFVLRPGSLSDFGAPKILDLYDCALSPSDITSQIVDFASDSDVDDIILYYCGHGFLSNDRGSYFVSIRNTREKTRTTSSLKVRDLALDLEEHLIGKRTFLIFDSCFAGDAAKEFMDVSGAIPLIEKHLEESFPRSGVAVIAATSGRDVALSKSEDKTTLFTGAFIGALEVGINAKSQSAYLSWRDIVEQVRRVTAERLGRVAPKPSITPVKNEDGDITTIPFFMNKAYLPDLDPTTHNITPLAEVRLGSVSRRDSSLGDECANGTDATEVTHIIARFLPIILVLLAVICIIGGGFAILDGIYSRKIRDIEAIIGRDAAVVAMRSRQGERVASVYGDQDKDAAREDAARKAQLAAAEKALFERQKALEEKERASRQARAEADAARQRAREEEEQRQRIAKAQTEAEERARAEAERVRLEQVVQANRCDQLASNPYDKNRDSDVDGVQFSTLKRQSEEAADACDKAMKAYSNIQRFKYQYARAIQTFNPRGAFALQAQLVRSNYPAAFDNFGWLSVLLNKDYVTAVDAFRRGAQLDDPDAMVSLAQMIEERHFVPQTPQETRVELYRRAAQLGHRGASEAYAIALKEENERAAAAVAVETAAGVLGGFLSGIARKK